MALGYFEEEEEQDNVDYIGFNDADDDDGDEAYDDSVFERYSEEEVRERWGEMSFEELLTELDRIISLSRRFFFSKRKRVVDGQETSNLVDLILENLPTELKTSRDIIASRDAIIANAEMDAKSIRERAEQYSAATAEDANQKAGRTIADAKKQAEDMVSVHAITQQARARAEQIIEEANRAAYAQKVATKKACDEHVATTMEWAQSAMSGSNDYVRSMLSAVHGVMMKSVTDVDDVAKRYAVDYEKRLSEIRRGPDFRAAARSAKQASAEKKTQE